MTVSKKPGTPNTARTPQSAAGNGNRIVAIPRAWLIGLSVMLVLPWLVAGGIYLQSGTARARSEGAPLQADDARPAAAGPWGRLTVRPIVVSPPLEYVAADWNRDEHANDWHFPGVSREMLEAFLVESGFTRDQVARLEAAATPDPPTGGLLVKPDLELVRGLSLESRTRLYTQLAKASQNTDQVSAFKFYGTSADDWLAGSLISPRTRQLVEPLIYRNGDFLQFADAALVQSAIADPGERQRLAKVLLRQSTMLVSLTVDDPLQVPALAEYWGRGGRSTDVRPLLESLSGVASDHSIDIVHLLPSFARSRLYRYPKLSTADLDRPLLVNCLWTSLNFFRAEPDDRFLDVPFALNAMRTEYYVVENSFRLGDLVALLDANGNLIHVAVYLADDLVFTKNGTSPVAPWAIMPIDRLKAFYASRSPNLRLIYHRRNDL